MDQPRACSPVNPNRVVATITGIQVMRALWQVWDAIDNTRPGSINNLVMPTIYVSCILSVMLMITGVIGTWSVYRLRVHTLNVCWWVFYMLTIFSFLNACTNLSIICLGKDTFVHGCITESVVVESCSNTEIITIKDNGSAVISHCEQTLPPPSYVDCRQLWEDSVIWAAIVAILDLLINLGFAYALYKCRVQYRSSNERDSSHDSGNHIQPGLPPPPYTHQDSDSESEEFVELK